MFPLHIHCVVKGWGKMCMGSNITEIKIYNIHELLPYTKEISIEYHRDLKFQPLNGWQKQHISQHSHATIANV
jgi:hypothetical protein